MIHTESLMCSSVLSVWFLCPLLLSALTHACGVREKTINTLFVGSQDSPQESATIKVVVLKHSYWLKKMQKNSVHITCGWLRDEWAGPVLAALQSSLRQQKSLVLKTHTHTHTRISTLILWEDAAKMTANVFSNSPKELTPASPFFKCILFTNIFTSLQNGLHTSRNSCS